MPPPPRLVVRVTLAALVALGAVHCGSNGGDGGDLPGDDAGGLDTPASDAPGADSRGGPDAPTDGPRDARADGVGDGAVDGSDGGPPGEPPLPPAAGKDRVLVVYNTKWTEDQDKDGAQDSLQIAQYYAKKRGIPDAHVLGIATGTDTGTDFASYQSEIAKPIHDALGKLGPTTIDVITLIYGIPLGLNDLPTGGTTKGTVDNFLMGLEHWTDVASMAWLQNPYLDNAPTFDKEPGHFDHATFKFMGSEMYLVARIDGPRGVAGPLDIIDQALYGERYVGTKPGDYGGTIYVDARFGHKLDDLAKDPDVSSGAYYAYDQGDKNMAYAARICDGFGFPVKYESTDKSIGEDGALFTDGSSAKGAPRALMYGGWYNYGRYVDGFEWLPGSVGCDLDSGSLVFWQVHGGDVWWGWNAFLRGATAVAGVATEPYLNGHPRPNILLYYMVKGYDFAEASALATPSIGWMPINVGDPLYAPLRKDKPHVLDDKAPKLLGAPTVWSNAGKTYLSLMVDDAIDPEVVKVAIDWGKDATYGTKGTSGEGYFRRPTLELVGATSKATIHYALTLTDPVGNVTKIADATTTVP